MKITGEQMGMGKPVKEQEKEEDNWKIKEKRKDSEETGKGR